jgi:putative phosphoesterase
MALDKIFGEKSLKIGLLSDVHGNIIGLKRCLDFFNGANVEKIFFLGDVIGYFPEPVRAMEMLQSIQAFCLLGNHDAMLIERMALDEGKDSVYQIKKTKKKIPRQYLRQITTWLPFLQKEIDGKRILFVHGNPWDPLNGYIYPDSDLQDFSKLPFDIVFMGHTHRPFIQQLSTVIVVNVGSCGLPRDRGNLASCAIYDTITGKCEVIRILFDTRRLIEKCRNHIHPSVAACLMRENQDQIFGTIVKGGNKCVKK